MRSPGKRDEKKHGKTRSASRTAKPDRSEQVCRGQAGDCKALFPSRAGTLEEVDHRWSGARCDEPEPEEKTAPLKHARTETPRHRHSYHREQSQGGSGGFSRYFQRFEPPEKNCRKLLHVSRARSNPEGLILSQPCITRQRQGDYQRLLRRTACWLECNG